jgi:hypothetical protein
LRHEVALFSVATGAGLDATRHSAAGILPIICVRSSPGVC